MDVRCPKCQTLYELDDTQVKASVVTLKCSQCQYVFRFESKQAAIQENHRRWMVRKNKTGDVLYCNTFDVMHQWIMKGQITKKDAISRTGNSWMVLGEIGEFVPVFQVVESISNLTGQPSPEDSAIAARKISGEHAPAELPVPQPVAPPAEPERERIRTEIQFGHQATEDVTQRARPSRPTPSALPPNPRVMRDERFITPQPPQNSEWELGGDVPHTHMTNEVTLQTEMPRSNASWIVAILILLVGVGAYVYFFQQPWLTSVVGTNTPPVSLTTDGPPQTAAVTAAQAPSEDPWALVQNAIDQALSAKSALEAQRFAAAMDALRPGFDSALGVATEEAELAAEGGGLKWKVDEARRALERGRAAQALSMYKDVLDIDARNSAAVAGIAWCYIEMGRFDDAASNFRRALELDPKEGDALIGLGTAERQRGNLKAAHDAYDLYLGRHPKGAKASIARYQLDALRKQLGM